MPSPQQNLQVVTPASRIIDREHERVGRWVAERVNGSWRIGAKCIGYERRGVIAAGVMYDQYNGASVCMDMAGEGRNWLTREFLWFMFYYPFEQMGVNVVIALIAGANTASRRFAEHLGFVLVAEIPDANPSGSQCIYAMHKENCRWLKRKVYRNGP